MLNFSLIGLGGYIAPRHLKAIKDSGNNLSLAYDVIDSVGVVDSYFPKTFFTTNEDEFFKQYDSNKIDYTSIVSPNYLHKHHIEQGLLKNTNVICEKPLVLTVSELDQLSEIEQKSGKKVNTILQLRVHESIKKLREKILSENKKDKYDVDLTYITSRGNWFHHSWKGQIEKSGGLATNIGIHFFDMLVWLFGDLNSITLYEKTDTVYSGYLELEKARVKWFLSVDSDFLPHSAKEANKTTFRSITLNGEELEFSDGFTDLHTSVYNDIIAGNGYGIEDARVSIKIAEEIRNLDTSGFDANIHPMLKK